MSRRLPRPAGWHWNVADPVLDDEGRPTCRWCMGVIAPPRRSYCCPQCAWEWQRRVVWRITREAVLKKSKYLCARCGQDVRLIDPEHCLKQYQYAQKIARKKIRPEAWKGWKPDVHLDADGCVFPEETWWSRYLKAIEWCKENKCLKRLPYDIDHIIPLCEGGDAYCLQNLQLLDARCHRIKTREDGSRRKKENR